MRKLVVIVKTNMHLHPMFQLTELKKKLNLE